MHAETAYLFRHAVLRDAAYGLQLPAARASLHFAVVEVMQAILAERPELRRELSLEIADHCRHGGDDARLQAVEGEFTSVAADYARECFRHQDELRLLQRLLEITGPERAAALHDHVGNALAQTGQLQAAIEAHERAVKAAVDRGDRQLEAVALSHIGGLQLRRGDPAAAQATLERGLIAARAAGDVKFEQACLLNLAAVAAHLKRREDGQRLRREALELARRHGNARSEVTALMNDALDLFHHGEPEAAERIYLAILDQTRERGMFHEQAHCLAALGGLYGENSRNQEAHDCLQQSWRLARESGNAVLCAVLLNYMGTLDSQMDQLESAHRRLLEALDAAREAQYPKFEASSLCHLAIVLVRLNRRSEAQEAWQKGTALFAAIRQQLELERMIETMRKALTKCGFEPLQ